MGANSKIEWCDCTFSPWVGCQKVSPGCDHCYAEAHFDTRLRWGVWGPHADRRRTSPAYWRKPLKWSPGSRVFCGSLCDVFDNKVPPEWRSDLWDLIRQTPHLTWMLLTKRPQNIRRMLPADWPLPQVWLGITAENQRWFDRRWAILEQVPAALRFVSYEPALGPLKIGGAGAPPWLICGGESGRDRRPMELGWARAVRDECAERGLAFFFKQVDKVQAIPPDLEVRQFPR